jgi:hypothetical protein
MTMTTVVLVNVLLALGLVGSLLVLLGLPGIDRDRHHRARLQGWHRSRGGRSPKHVAE